MSVRICTAVVLIASLLAACSSVSPSNEAVMAKYATAPTPAGPGRGSFTAASTGGVPGRPAAPLPAPSFDQGASELQYRLGPLDTVNILVFQVPDLSGDFQVGSDGMLGLPLIGSVRASGRTASEVQKDVTAKLAATYLQQPQVTVKVTGFNSQKVTVDGTVAKPGIFPVASGGGTLLEYIALAGGMPRQADTSNVVIFRQIEGKRMAARFDVSQIRKGMATDPIVYGGDTIVVPASGVRSAWADFLSAVPVASFAASVGGL